MNLEISKIVGSSTQTGWSQVHTFFPEEKEKIVQKGSLLAVFSLNELPPGTEIALAGKELISRLHEEYFGKEGESPFILLKEAVEKVSQEVSSGAKLEIVAGVVWKKALFLAIVGGGRVVFSRQGKLGTILQGKEGEILPQMASGYLAEGDMFLLGTKRFFEIVSWENLQSALTCGSATGAGEILTPLVLGKEEGLAAAVVANVGEKLLQAPEIKKEKGKAKIERIKKFLLAVKRKITQPPPEKPKKSWFAVALILFLILGVTMVFGARARKQQAEEQRITKILEEVKAKKEEGEAILNLNPSKARESLLAAKEILRQIEGEKISSPKLAKIKEELAASLEAVLQEHEVAAKLFFDLELIKKEAEGKDFALEQDRLLVLDNKNQAIYEVEIENKKSAILVAGEKLAGAKKLAAGEGKIFVFTNEGIYQVSGKNLSLVVPKDEEWGEILDLKSFATNLYLLTEKTIWIYPATENGFGTKRNWPKGEVNFSRAKGMAIDGAIWVLNEEGAVEKFVRGIKEGFSLTGLGQPLTAAKTIYTEPEQKFLYILEDKRLIFFTKTGEYQAQYLWSGIEPMAVVVSEEKGKAFLLQGSKIYSVDIRQ